METSKDQRSYQYSIVCIYYAIHSLKVLRIYHIYHIIVKTGQKSRFNKIPLLRSFLKGKGGHIVFYKDSVPPGLMRNNLCYGVRQKKMSKNKISPSGAPSL